jgi:hypothetical protein
VLLSQFAEAASIFIKPIIRGLNSIIGSIQEVAKSAPLLTGLVVVIGGLLVVVLGAAGALLTLAAMVGFAFLGIQNLTIMMAASTAATATATTATTANTVAKASNMAILRAYVLSLKAKLIPGLAKAGTAFGMYTGVIQANTVAMAANRGWGVANAGVLAGSTTTMVGGFFGTIMSGLKKLGGWFVVAGGYLVKFLNLLRLFGGPVLLAIIIIVGVFKGLFSALKEAWNSEAGVFLREGFRSFAEGIYAVISPIFMILKLFVKLISIIVEMVLKVGVMKLIFLALGGALKVVGFLLKIVGAVIWGIAKGIEYVVNKIIDLMNVVLKLSAGVWNALVPESMETEVSVISKSESVPSWDEFTGGEKEMAAGGVATGPTRALIGESGPEAVLPLSYLGSIISSAMKSSEGSGSNSGVGDTVVPITVNLDGERLGLMEERVRARDLRRAMNHGNLGLRGIG